MLSWKDEAVLLEEPNWRSEAIEVGSEPDQPPAIAERIAGSGMGVAMEDLPEEFEPFRDKIEDSIYYSSQYGMPPEIAYNMSPGIKEKIGPLRQTFPIDDEHEKINKQIADAAKMTLGTFLSAYPSPVAVPLGIIAGETKASDVILGFAKAVTNIHAEKKELDRRAKIKEKYKYPYVAAGMGGFSPFITKETAPNIPVHPIKALAESGKGVVRFLEAGVGGAFGGTAYDWLGQFVEQGGYALDQFVKLGSKNKNQIYNPLAESIIAFGQNVSKWGKESRQAWAEQAAYGREALDPALAKIDPISYGAGRISEGLASSALSVLAMYLSGGTAAGAELLNKGNQLNRGLLLLSGLSAAGGFQHAQEQKENFLWSTLHALADGGIEYFMETTFLEGIGKSTRATTAGFKEGAEELFTGLLQNTRAGILENTNNGMTLYEATKKAFGGALKQAPWEVAAGFLGGWGMQGGLNMAQITKKWKQTVPYEEEPGTVKVKSPAEYAKQIKKLIIPWSEMRQRLAEQAAEAEGKEQEAFQKQIDEMDEQQAQHIASIAREGLKETEPTITPEISPKAVEGEVLYHGTGETFEAGEIEEGRGNLRKGIYLSDSEAAAKTYGKYVHKYTLSPDAKILDLSDGESTLNFILKEGILEKEDIDVDLENYILEGRIFQADPGNKQGIVDDIVATAKDNGFDIVKLFDDLGGESDNIATVVVNKSVLQTPAATKEAKPKEKLAPEITKKKPAIEDVRRRMEEREADESDEQLSGITKKRRRKLVKETAAKIKGHDIYQTEVAAAEVREREIGPGFYFVHESGRGEVEAIIGKAKGFKTKLQKMFTFDRADATSGRATAWDVAVQVGYENIEEQADMDLSEFVQMVADSLTAKEGVGGLSTAALRTFEESGYPDAEMLAEKFRMLRRGSSDVEINEMITEWAEYNDIPIEAVMDEFVNADRIVKIAEMSEAEQDAEIERLATEQILAEDQIAAQQAAVDILEANDIKAEVRTVEEIEYEDDVPFERAGGRPTGAAMTRGQREVILLALGADVETGAHEGWHLLRNRLTESDLAVLEKHFGKDIAGEEAEATAFGRFYKEGKEPSTAIRKIFDKIKAILAKIRSALEGKGFRTVEDIFGEAAAGTVAKRGTRDAARGTKFEQKTPIWYSKLERAVTDSMPNKISAEAFRGWSAKQGIKKEEMLWSGVDELLTKQDTVTKAEILETMAANNVQIEEVVKGGKAADAKERNLHVITEELRVLENKIDDAWHSLNAKLRQVPDEQRDKYGIRTAEQRNALVDEVAYLDKEPQQRAIKKIEEILPEYDINEILDLIDEQTELKHEREVVRAEQEYAGSEPKFSQYKLPGGENYREVLLRLPGTGYERNRERLIKELKRLESEKNLSTKEKRFANTEWSRARKELDQLTEGRNITTVQEGFTEGHWQESNVLAHFRMDDRTDKAGKKVLFIEEIQSDWHQKGRAKGYRTKLAEAEWTEEIDDRGIKKYNYTHNNITVHIDKEEVGRFYVYEIGGRLGNTTDTLARAKHVGEQWLTEKQEFETVPDAPFKTTWHELAFKRILRYAADEGYDKVAWTTGEQQIDRYEEALRQNVDEIRYEPFTNKKGKWWEISAYKDGRSVFQEDEADIDRIYELLGKDIAEKIENDKGKILPDQPYREWRSISGEGLSIGGEGMKGFYDKILPAFVKKYMKKWGVKAVGETTIVTMKTPSGMKAGVDVHAVPVTAAMKESVAEGQVMYESASQQLRREAKRKERIESRKARIKAQADLVPSKKKKKKGPGIRRLKINIREITPALRADLLPEDLDKVIGSAIPGAEELPKTTRTMVKPVYDKAWFDRNMEVQGRSIRDKSSSEGKRAWIALEKKFTPMSTRLFNIAPKLFQATRKFIYDQMTRTVWLSDEVSPFVNDIKKMDKADRRAMDLALKNGIDWKIAELTEKYGVEADYEKARAALDEIYEAAKEVGIKIEYMKDYWPRILSDREGFLMYFQGRDDWSIIEEMIKKRAEQAGRQVQDMTPDEIAQDINVLMRGYQLQNLVLSRPGAAKERTVESVTAEIDSFYEDSLTAVYKYIKQMTAKIGEREFFGRETKLIQGLRKTQRARLTRLTKLKRKVGLKAGTTEQSYKEHISKTYEAWMATNERLTRLKARPLTDTIGGYIDRIRHAGLIKPSEEIQVQNILNAIFDPTRMGRVTSLISSGVYLDTLNSPLQAITQLDEFAYSFFRDPVRSIPALITTIARQSKVTPKDIGITSIGEEFQGPSMQRALGLLLKSTGFEEIDRLNKENYINTVLRKYQSQAKNAENNPDFVKRMQKVFGNEYQGVIADLKKNEITYNIKYLLFNELLDIQPLAISEMPESYAKAGGWRLAYSLKSFYIRRLDYVRNECFKDMKSKDTFVRGFSKLVWLSFSFALMGAGSDWLKDFIRGKKFDLEDSLVDNLLRMAFFSKYQAWRTREKGFGTAIIEGWRPPTKAIDSVSRDIINTAMGKDRGFELWRSVPIIGEEYYWWFGAGADKNSRGGSGGIIN